MRRALNVRDILNKKYDVFPFEGKWKDAFDTPEVRGCWFVWGNSGNGKTSFVMQLCKELCKYDRVAFNSLEEGTSLTVQNNLRRFGMADTMGAEQLNSYESQKKYYYEKINNNPEWQYVDIYADEGISGTTDYRRASFMKMIQDALSGKIDLILTKSMIAM